MNVIAMAAALLFRPQQITFNIVFIAFFNRPESFKVRQDKFSCLFMNKVLRWEKREELKIFSVNRLEVFISHSLPT